MLFGLPNRNWFRSLIGGVILVVGLLAGEAVAQRHAISGTVYDGATGEILIGANLYAVTFKTGAASNAYGFYSLTLPRADSLTLVVSYVGYQPQIKKIYLTSDVALDVRLRPATEAFDAVTITAEGAAALNVRRTQMSVIDVPIRLVERLPVILSEQDLFRVMQLLPGVQAAQEGTTGIHVRGGNIDQNLVQLDEAPVYNPNHLFGLFSTFNTKALNNVTLVKGGFPAYYGGKLSSVVEINMREGNKQEFSGDGGVGLITSHLSVEGPIRSDRASFIVSARRSYIDVLARPFQGSGDHNTYYFYDVNAKVNHQLSPTDRVHLSLFQGRDVGEYIGASGVGYGIRFGNSTGTLRWNHLFGPRLFSNTSIIGNDYFLRSRSVQSQFYSQNFSGIKDFTIKQEFEYYPNPSHNLRFGAVFTHHNFRSTGVDGGVASDEVIPPFDESNIIPRHANQMAVYLNDRWEASPRFGLNLGLRVPFYTGQGADYLRLEPRLSAKVAIDDASTVKGSYTMMNQFVHSVPSTTASLPTDLWIPSSDVTKPQHAQQVAIGYFRNFRDNAYETSVEVYYKWMESQVLFKQGTQLLEFANVDDDLTYGKGWSYGAEVFVRKGYGRFSGWVSYTLSWTRQKFPQLNFGREFPFRYDRRHNLAIVASGELSRRWTVSADFVFSSGIAYTLPIGRVFSAQGGDLYNGLFYDYRSLNNFRLASTHRLDLSARYKMYPRWFEEAELVFGIYNAYNRQNPYYVYLDMDTTDGHPVGKQVSLLPIIPSVSFNFTF